MAGLHIGAPARLQRGGRAAQPGGTSTPLVRNLGELLSRTYSGRVDYRRRLELNTQDSDEDVLFRQEMRYPEREAGGFSSLRRAGAGEGRDSPPAQLLEESEYQMVSKSASERGRSRYREHQDRPSAGREEIGLAPITRSKNLPTARERSGAHRLVRVNTLGAFDPGQVQRQPTDCPCL
jgi:hypothetical protein